MVSFKSLKDKKVLIFGLGLSGISTAKRLKKNVKNLSAWDDNSATRINVQKKLDIAFDNNFSLKNYDFIVISPGINIYKHPKRNFFKKNFSKIITDVDIFTSSINLKKNKIILITGTNGKSTFSKLLYHVLKKGSKNTYLLGNYGKPVLNFKNNNNKNYYVLELSSYQIEYSKFLKSHSCTVLNITPDHLDRHRNFSSYINIKLKIFNSLLSTGRGYVSAAFPFFNLIKNKKVYKVNFLKTRLTKNKFLDKKNFLSSISVIYKILKFLKFSDKKIFKGFDTFKPLSHRQEFVRKIKNVNFINDSKATNFDSAKFSLEYYDNIFWIVGGLLKKNDKLNLSELIISKIKKIYLIGKSMSALQSKLPSKISMQKCKTLIKAVHQSFKDAKNLDLKNSVVLLSPGAASFDQFNNFEHRGNEFKRIVRSI